MSAYDLALRTSPYRTKALTSCFVSATGDVVAQYATTEGDFDGARTARQSLWGLAMGPLSHNIFRALSYVRAVGPIPAPVMAVVVDQLCFSVPIHLTYFAWISSASSGFMRPLTEVRADAWDRLWPALKASYMVWPAAIYMNVSFVPLPYRVLFVNVVGLYLGTRLRTIVLCPILVLCSGALLPLLSIFARISTAAGAMVWS